MRRRTDRDGGKYFEFGRCPAQPTDPRHADSHDYHLFRGNLVDTTVDIPNALEHMPGVAAEVALAMARSCSHCICCCVAPKLVPMDGEKMDCVIVIFGQNTVRGSCCRCFRSSLKVLMVGYSDVDLENCLDFETRGDVTRGHGYCMPS